MLPGDFTFSQTSLQDFVDCARRFQLRYVERRRWPALLTDDPGENERRMRAGDAFHRLVHQHLSGISAEVLSRQLAESQRTDPDVRRWWASWLAHAPLDALPATRRAETTLTARIDGQAVLAKFDVLAVDQATGQVVIVDWKTTPHRPTVNGLSARLQTRLYRALVVLAGAAVMGGAAVDPAAVTMTYWFTEFPDAPIHLPYSAAAFAADVTYLRGLLADVAGRGADDFALTEDARRCRFCEYRSLCDRGVAGGPLSEADLLAEDDESLAIDVEQIGELAF